LDKNPVHSKAPKLEDKSRTKAKLNPWRTSSKEVAPSYTDNSQLEISKHEEREVDTPQTVSIFKQTNGNAAKFS
jgi:hypothetical protein